MCIYECVYLYSCLCACQHLHACVCVSKHISVCVGERMEVHSMDLDRPLKKEERRKGREMEEEVLQAL